MNHLRDVEQELLEVVYTPLYLEEVFKALPVRKVVLAVNQVYGLDLAVSFTYLFLVF